MAILVELPRSYTPERQYICDTLLGEFLGLTFETVTVDRRDVRVSMGDDPEGREIILRDALFETAEDDWLTTRALPTQPLTSWDIRGHLGEGPWATPSLPVIYARPLADGSLLTRSGRRTELALDVLGSAFFMLTRYEELVKADRDKYDRFPASASLGYQAGFLDRPIVNEYTEALWRLFLESWPSLQKRPRSFRLLLSHDVDTPQYAPGRPWYKILRGAAYDLIGRRNPELAARRLASSVAVACGRLDADINNTFDAIMDFSEHHGLKDSFYFFSDRGDSRMGGRYDLTNPWIRRLVTRIHHRGHEVGLHATSGSYLDASKTRHEFDNLRMVAEAEGIRPEGWGGRLHYLCWEGPTTWQAWADAGLHYDSTLSYADRAGFRCGVCYEYRVFNLLTRQALPLWERPLIVMEASVLGKEYMNLSRAAAYDVITGLRDRCRLVEGDFTLLWHQDGLTSRDDFRLYKQIVQRCR